MDNISLVVSSCDKYSTAWYPYFELVKKFWPTHPRKIILITESKSYSHPGLDIVTVKGGRDDTWSQRLLKALDIVDTEYIIFSLEDFFLLGPVDQQRIDNCAGWMDENRRIAQCRLSTWQAIELGEEYEPGSGFYYTSEDTPFRLDTQVALWRKSDLISFIDPKESPWQFEGEGTKRINGTDKLLLWYHQADMHDISKMIFPYSIDQSKGYGIAWRHWLWNNKAWFKQCGIKGVPYWKLGVLSEKSVARRYKYLYCVQPTTNFKWRIMSCYINICRNTKYAWHCLLSSGIVRGGKEAFATLRKHF